MGLRRNIMQEPISALSLRRCPTTTATDTVREAIAILKRDHLGTIIIVDDDGMPKGMYNEHMLMRLLAENPAGLDDPVGDHMTTYVVCLRRDEPIAKLIATMYERKLRWVCVVDNEGRPISLSGLRGVIEYVSEYFPHQVAVQPISGNKLSVDQREGA
jgi:CBS domain-containing protein